MDADVHLFDSLSHRPQAGVLYVPLLVCLDRTREPNTLVMTTLPARPASGVDSASGEHSREAVQGWLLLCYKTAGDIQAFIVAQDLMLLAMPSLRFNHYLYRVNFAVYSLLLCLEQANRSLLTPRSVNSCKLKPTWQSVSCCVLYRVSTPHLGIYAYRLAR